MTTPEPRRQAGYVPLRHRRESYADELGQLATTYQLGRTRDNSKLRATLRGVLGKPTWYIGSGGALAVARYAADLQNRATGDLATAVTSVGFASSAAPRNAGVVIISAGARHPDTAAAVRAALEREVETIILVTEKTPDQLSGVLASPKLSVVTLSPSGIADGFLATNSILSMVTAFSRVYEHKTLPKNLPSLKQGACRVGVHPGDDVIVLTGSTLWGPAIDLETRLLETGLNSVQLTDYRNFAHGRHYGLSQNAERSRIVAFVNSELEELAKATLKIFPNDVPILRLYTDLIGTAGEIDLFVASMKLLADISQHVDFDPARPAVPKFGRELYHLNSSSFLSPRCRSVEIERKLSAGHRRIDEDSVFNKLESARSSWLNNLVTTPIGGVVLDYDGTVCETDNRFALPEMPVQEAIVRILEMGVHVGFASGRGASLINSLRDWVPAEYHSLIHLGLYNGSVRTVLTEAIQATAVGQAPADIGVDGFHSRSSIDFLKRMRECARELGSSVEVRSHQISITRDGDHFETDASLSVAVREIVSHFNSLPSVEDRMKVVESGHSFDILFSETSKVAVLQDVENASGLRALSIGDQGQFGGNDFELLSYSDLSLSVDRVSSDATRCWRLGDAQIGGPRLLVRYLNALRRNRRRQLTFRWESSYV